MSIYALIAEFNPLHVGHLSLIQRIRQESDCDALIIAMSGPFTQRGIPSVMPTLDKAEMAIHAGGDLVVEIPQLYATASAEKFAKGAILTLQNALPAVDVLAFGCEDVHCEPWLLYQHTLKTHADAFQGALSISLKNKTSYPLAYDMALQAVGIPSLKDAPNARLALSYAHYAPPTWKFFPCARIENVSASKIRQKLVTDALGADSLLPSFVQMRFNKLIHAQWLIPDLDLLLPMLKVLSLSRSMHSSDGWHHHFVSALEQSTNYNQLLDLASTRHHTRASVQRHILEWLSPSPSISQAPQYTRILAANEVGRRLLKETRRHAPAPRVLAPAKHAKLLNDASKISLEHDIKREAFSTIFQKNDPWNQMFRCYREKPRMV